MTFLCSPQFWGEIAKLTASLLAALLVARIAVYWALARYKAEKGWERETAALLDVATAIADMVSVNREWVDDYYEIEARRSETSQQDLRERYHRSRAKLREVTAVGTIILDDAALTVVSDLQMNLDREVAEDADFQDETQHNQKLLEAASEAIEAIARRHVRSR